MAEEAFLVRAPRPLQFPVIDVREDALDGEGRAELVVLGDHSGVGGSVEGAVVVLLLTLLVAVVRWLVGRQGLGPQGRRDPGEWAERRERR